MTKQKGFTLIELLLVLAIIGIISAIAVPALLGQRARARDKSAITNMTGTMGDLIGTWDKTKESGAAATACITAMEGVLTTANLASKNPWDGTLSAYNATIATTSALPTVVGEATYYLVNSNTLVGKVLVQNSVNGSTMVVKRSNIE